MKNFSFLFEFSPEAVPKTKIGVKILHLGGTDYMHRNHQENEDVTQETESSQ